MGEPGGGLCDPGGIFHGGGGGFWPGEPRDRLFPGSLSPALHVHECVKFLLLMSLEALLLLLLISRKFFLVSTLLQFQPITLLF